MATPTFSYAQAAKGQTAKSVSSAASTTAPSKTASGTNTPAKDPPSSATIPNAPGTSWADDAVPNDDSVGQPIEKQNNTREKKVNSVPPQSTSQTQSTLTGVSSPELGTTSSSSTNMDDVSSLPNASSESTWENKSQTSNTPDKSAEGNDQRSSKGKVKESDKPAPPSVLQPAPMPTVNIWKQRADEAKAKAASKVPAAKPASSGSVAVAPVGLSQGPDGTRKKSKGPDATDVKEKPPSGAPKKVGEDEKLHQPRNGTGVVDGDRNRKGGKSRAPEKESQRRANVPPPSVRDQESWPTPEIAVDEGRKKAQGKSEKSEKERSQVPAARPHGKKEWNTMTITPNVIFQTPLPSTAPARRGGRGPGRGGASTGGRGSSYSTGVSSADKDASNSSTILNGEQNRRGRSEGAAGRDPSPVKGRRAISSGSPAGKESSALGSYAEKAIKDSVTQEQDIQSRKSSALPETSSIQSSGQNNGFPRQYSSKGLKGRRGDLSSQGERRNGELVSPTKENNAFDRRTSAITYAETAEGDIQSAQSKQPNDRRPFGSFSGRERARGGARGGRGGSHGFQNGHHQFANGQQPLHASATFPLPLSPTTFNPDQGAYFAPSTAPNRNYRANGPRSQSVTTDNMYRPAAYSGGPQPIAPIQTYVGGMYDYQMPPMSAVPYSPFVDQITLLNMVSTQLEYYFSVENLCKDIFLRKHMDSKGFVFLSFIADFNRIKNLTTDMELIKLVCYQSQVIEFQVGGDGKERLRRHDGWEQWVLNKSDRDPSAQNDGSEEMYNPPVPHPHGFEPQSMPRYPDVPAMHDVPFRPVNGVHSGDLANDQSANGAPTPLDQTNGTHPLPSLNEPDAFSDEQVETLSVIVRKQDQVQPPLPPSATRTFSNGSIDSRSGILEEDKSKVRHPSLKVNGTGPSLGVDGKLQEESRRSSNPQSTPVRLYWVKGKENPVESLPPESSYEFYTHLRSKALEQRQNAPINTCPYDMDVLYQFWSHFLIRNFNTRMYNEFRYFAFEDASQKSSDVGLNNLIKFYGESLSSKQNLIRERVARHYVDLVHTEQFEEGKPAFKQLRSAWRNGALDLKNRKCISKYIDEELRTSLEQ